MLNLLPLDILPVAQAWQEWGDWSTCTSSCGNGLKIRARACHQPGLHDCEGSSTEVTDCGSAQCPGEIDCCTFLSDGS